MLVAAIIPAFNEEKTIGSIVQVVRSVSFINDVVVVSDGSTDNTAAVARKNGARVIELKTNHGKGGAMKIGIESTREEVLLFLDADLIGLTAVHVQDLVRPVLEGEAEMSIGLFDQGRIATDLAQALAPYLSGQRAVRREVLQEVSDLEICRFGVEVALTRHARKKGIRVVEVALTDMSHHMKEEKLGMVKGFAARLKMYWEIARYLQRDLVHQAWKGRH